MCVVSYLYRRFVTFDSISPRPCTSPITTPAVCRHDAVCLLLRSFLCTLYWVLLLQPRTDMAVLQCRHWAKMAAWPPSLWHMLGFSYPSFCCHCLHSLFVLVPPLYRFAWAHQPVLRFQQFFCYQSCENKPVSASAQLLQTKHAFHFSSVMYHTLWSFEMKEAKSIHLVSACFRSALEKFGWCWLWLSR